MQIICDQCGAVIGSPTWQTLREGDIEYTYFICQECGSPYRICTTDSKLRKKIESYQKMAERLKTGTCTDAYRKRARKMKEDNVKRSRELTMQYPFPPK